MTAADYIQTLQLQPHPEGGFYKEIYRAGENISQECLPGRFTGQRQFSTAIYYLLQKGDYSGFHKIKSDECWHFYAGETLLIHILHANGYYNLVRLGNRLNKGETFQYVVPANTWFAAEPAEATVFALTGCTVSPGFDYTDFEMAHKESLLKAFPKYNSVIERLCR